MLTAVTNLEVGIPEIKLTVLELNETATRVTVRAKDLGDRLKRLQREVQKTRELANRIKVGVDFKADTTVEVIPPGDPSEFATSTKVYTVIAFFNNILICNNHI